MRTKELVIKDIKKLVNKKGFFYALCMILSEDFLVIAEDIHKIDTYARVSNNEALLLFWFLIQNKINYDFPELPKLIEIKKEIYNLLEELHNSFEILFISKIEEWIKNWFKTDNYQKDKKDFFWNWEMLIEPIFYAGSWVYDFQYLEYLDKKYKYDRKRLLENKNFHIDDNIKIANEIKRILHEKSKKINFQWLKEKIPSIIEDIKKKYPNRNIEKEAEQMLSMMELYQYLELFFENKNIDYSLPEEEIKKLEIESFYYWLIDLFVIRKSDFDISIDSFLDNFSIDLKKDINSNFKWIGDFNILNSKPIIKLDEERYFVPINFILFQAIYETPYYWIMDDNKYLDKASTNRWNVWEEVTYDFLVKVFWKDNIYKSVIVESKKWRTETDIDILCILWSKALCIQVKSKRLTILSRKWDDKQILKDFKWAVQDAYKQWLTSRDSILDKNVKLINEDWDEIKLSTKINEVYIMWITTENYPSLNHQANTLLEKKENDPNAIFLSIFDLELLVHYLRDPYDFLYYIRQRIDLIDYFNAEEEIVFLGFHLENKLWIDEKYNMCAIDNQFWQIIDRNYYPYKAWLDIWDKWDSIKSLWKNPSFYKLFDEIKEIKSEYITDVIFHLLDLSWEWRDNLIQHIINGKEKTWKDWKSHIFSVPDVNITYVSLDSNSQEELKKQVICFSEKHKYKSKSEVWVWFWSLKDSKKIIDLLFFHKEEWKYIKEAEDLVLKEWNTWNTMDIKTWKKLYRKSPCPCWSKKKFKRCCWDKYYT